MVLESVGHPLELRNINIPEPDSEQVLLRVEACAVCRTDLHIIDGDLTEANLPLIPGHEIVGIVEQCGSRVERFQPGDRVGVPWLGRTCGRCHYCRTGRENLCDAARFTGYHFNGGYAEYTTAHQHFSFPLSQALPAHKLAPLMCAGLIGYRSLRMTGDAQRIGIYGFGAAAHIVIQLAIHEGREIYAFTRSGDNAAQQFAMRLGAAWAGASTASPPHLLDAAILFAPVGELVPAALAVTVKGGTVVCGGIHMSDIPAFPYELLWGERSLRSVANLTRRDGEAFLELAAKIPLRTDTVLFPLSEANQALERLRNGELQGAAVLTISNPGV
jgi:propanol-preferring alcohol dehydrogenase